MCLCDQGQLYLLVTDQGFLTEEKVVWESLHNVDGDGNFCDSEFRLRPPSDPETVYRGQQDQIDQVRPLRQLGPLIQFHFINGSNDKQC